MSHATLETFANQIKAVPGGEHLELCYACGTCVSQCMIQQKIELKYNPRRLFHLAILDLKDEAFTNPTTWLCTACDLCYPACPQKIHISEVILAFRSLAVQAGQKSIIKSARVNDQTCVACGLCAQACPYEAIQLVEKKVANRGVITLAQVDSALCMACGVCGAVCRSTSIGIEEEYADSILLDRMWQWLTPAREV